MTPHLPTEYRDRGPIRRLRTCSSRRSAGFVQQRHWLPTYHPRRLHAAAAERMPPAPIPPCCFAP